MTSDRSSSARARAHVRVLTLGEEPRDDLLECTTVDQRLAILRDLTERAWRLIPRATQDLDICIEPTPENAERVWEALVKFGALLDDLDIGPGDFVRPETVIQVGLPPNRIDVLTEITGVTDFEAAWASRSERQVSNRTIPFLGREPLVTNKRAAGA